MSKQPPSCTYCKRYRPLPYYDPDCRTPRHWKFTQDHRTTRPPPPPRDRSTIPRKLLKKLFLYRKAVINGQDFQQLFLPMAFRDVVFQALPDDLGHQGRDRTTSLVKQRFYWPGIDSLIRREFRHMVVVSEGFGWLFWV